MTDNYLPLFLNDIHLIDVRAPVEFDRGSFPTATNIPLLNDDERARVGTLYKLEGQEAAIRLGHQLVSGDIKALRVEQWLNFARQNPEGFLFCFRGGLRSKTSQGWMAERGMSYPLVKGGYKALRRFLIDSFENLVTTRKFFIISGRTGVGKTIVINRLKNAVDLENLANHRGSSFGKKVTDQPSQINFENALAIHLLKTCHASDQPIFVEDESHLVGRCALPVILLSGMRSWPIIVVEDTFENRVTSVQKDYVTDMLAAHIDAFGDEGFVRFSEFLKGSLFRVRKRLGGERYKEILSQMENALTLHQTKGDESFHRLWIEGMLAGYYDPMYDYQLAQKKDRVVFKGNREEVLSWCGAAARGTK